MPHYDLDLPIALKKSVRSSTKHPICNFVFYKGISSRHRDFVSNLHQIKISNSLYEAIQVFEWWATILDKILVLEKNKACKLTKLSLGNEPLVLNGSLLSNIKHLEVWKDTKLDLWQRDSAKHMRLTARKLLPLLQNSTLYVFSYPLHLIWISPFTN